MVEPFLNEKHLVLRRSVRSFCEAELGPIAAAIDQEARFPWDVAEKMGQLGYFGIQAPRELGGARARAGLAGHSAGVYGALTPSAAHTGRGG